MSSCPVSVVIPTYNRAEFLKRTIDSVLRQTLACSEIIIVNDGSTDNSLELLQAISENSRVPLRIITTENQGVAAARNRGIITAKHEYIAFLDSDDHWHKKKLELQYGALAKESEYVISHTKERWFRRGLHLNQKKIHIPRQGNIFDHCLQLCAVGMSTVIVKKELFETVGYFDESLICCEDYDIWLRASCKYPFLLIDEKLTIKEGGREDQLSFIHRVGMDEKRIYSIRKLLDANCLSADQKELAIKSLIEKITVFAKGCEKHGKVDEARRYFDLLKEYTPR